MSLERKYNDWDGNHEHFQTNEKIVSVNISQKQTGLCKFFASFI